MNRPAWIVVVGLVAANAAPAFAQPAPTRADMESRYQIGQLERVLEGAVEHGVTVVRIKMQEVTQLPMDLMVSDNAHARGFRLEGYGVFFDVIAPSFETSALVMRMMDQKPNTLTLTQLAQPATAGVREQTGSTASLQDRDPQPAAPTDPILTDPNEVYRTEVTVALKDAMLDHSISLNVGPNEWLTIAVKGNDIRPRLAPADTTGRTVILRLRGVDLAAYGARQIDRDTALSRIEVRVF
ncbi:MAG TPA: hypothetical protein VEU08_13345 [Vicinamibacterales bacterium]|nr:hypothetical protein [Vicinamibacterales bacterium]